MPAPTVHNAMSTADTRPRKFQWLRSSSSSKAATKNEPPTKRSSRFSLSRMSSRLGLKAGDEPAPREPRKRAMRWTTRPESDESDDESDRVLPEDVLLGKPQFEARGSFASTASTASSPASSATSSSHSLSTRGNDWDLEPSWRVVRIQGDGNCLFRAISDQIYRNEAFYGDIRQRVVNYIEQEQELFRPFVEHEGKAFEPIADYCARMRRDGEWGGNPELYAAARLFNIQIVVHQGSAQQQLRIDGCEAREPGAAPHRVLNLLYRGDHYDSLHDDAMDEHPRLSTTVSDLALDSARTIHHVQSNCSSSDDTGEEDNSEQTKKTKKKKKKKGVVIIGEEARAEVVELPEIVVLRPTRAVVEHGKVQAPPQETTTRIAASVSVVSTSEETDYELSDGAVVVAEVAPVLMLTSSSPPRQPKFGQRVCFRAGRRIAAA